MFSVWAQSCHQSNILKYIIKPGFLHTSNDMPVSKVAWLLCCFVMTSEKGVQVPLCPDRVHQGSLSPHHVRLVTFSEALWHRAAMSGHFFPVIVTPSVLRLSNFCFSLRKPGSYSRYTTYYQLRKTQRTMAHTHRRTLDISPFLCSAAFHYINLSNSENIQEARWICSRLQHVLLSLVQRESFRSFFPYFYQVLFTSCYDFL